MSIHLVQMDKLAAARDLMTEALRVLDNLHPLAAARLSDAIAALNLPDHPAIDEVLAS